MVGAFLTVHATRLSVNVRTEVGIEVAKYCLRPVLGKLDVHGRTCFTEARRVREASREVMALRFKDF